ncbi:MAG: hypothetical protein RLZZ293_1327 [Pseudomonadota bacterium]|jgi:MFS family permease
MFFIASISIDLSLTGLVGYRLTTNKLLATLPYSFIVLGTAICTIPASLFMQKYGRKLVFLFGTCCALISGISRLLFIKIIYGCFVVEHF